jgi:hypothetical protein
VTNSIEAILGTLNIQNVFVYVGDAVRWDFRPSAVTDRGSTYRTVAASIHSPTSFATLVTGRHPPAHGVSSFENRLPESVPRLFDLEGYETRFVNSVIEQQDGTDPIFSVLDVEPTHTKPFENLSEPFISIERGPGGHAPYTGTETAREYFCKS